MFNIGAGELIFIMVAALLVLGPQRLPEFARAIGKFVREFRRQTDDVRNVVEREFYKMDQEILDEPRPPVPMGRPASLPSPVPETPPVNPAALQAVALPAPEAVAEGTAVAAPEPAPAAGVAGPGSQDVPKVG